MRAGGRDQRPRRATGPEYGLYSGRSTTRKLRPWFEGAERRRISWGTATMSQGEARRYLLDYPDFIAYCMTTTVHIPIVQLESAS